MIGDEKPSLEDLTNFGEKTALFILATFRRIEYKQDNNKYKKKYNQRYYI